MADEIVYVTVTPAVTEIVEVESFTPEPVIVTVHINEVFNGVSFLQELEPEFPEDGNTWYRPSTNRLYVRQSPDWLNPGVVLVEGVAVSKAVSSSDRMWTILYDGSNIVVPAVDGIVFRKDATVQMLDNGFGPELVVSTTGGGEKFPNVGPWIDLEMWSGFTPVAGLQHPQWRHEGSHGRFRGHYVHPTGTVRRAIALLPQGFDSASLNNLFCGIGKTAGGVQTVARWDTSKSAGVLYADNQFSIDHTKPMSMNARYIIDAATSGTTTSPWTPYGQPWPSHSDRHDVGRNVLCGLMKNGAAGTSQIYRFPYTPGEFRAAGGTWILASCDAAGPMRVDVSSTADEVTVTDVTNSTYAVLDGIEWVTQPADYKFTALPMVNGWVNYGGGYAPAGYAIFGDSVYVRGLVRNGTAGATIATLPVGYRPPAKMIFPVQNAGGTNRQLSVDVDGTIKQEAGHNGNAWVSICVNFSITP